MGRMIDFAEWLRNQMRARNLRQADLITASRGELKSGTLTDILKGRRNAGKKTLILIADAMRISREEVLRAAGVLEKQSRRDELAEEADYLFEQIKTKEGKRAALAMLRGLVRTNDENKTHGA